MRKIARHDQVMAKVAAIHAQQKIIDNGGDPQWPLSVWEINSSFYLLCLYTGSDWAATFHLVDDESDWYESDTIAQFPLSARAETMIDAIDRACVHVGLLVAKERAK